VDSVGVSPCRNVWMQPFLSWRSSLSSCVAALSNLLLAVVRKRRPSLRSLPFSATFCLVLIGQSYALSVLLGPGVAFHAQARLLTDDTGESVIARPHITAGLTERDLTTSS
jgi:hypothetical protein